MKNLFKKQKRVLQPQWTTTYPDGKSEKDYQRRITVEKESNDSGEITGILYTVTPNNRPDVNQWATEVNFASRYKEKEWIDFVNDESSKTNLSPENVDSWDSFLKGLREKFLTEQIRKDEYYFIMKLFPPKPFKLDLKTKVISYLNRHL